ncbi:MAG TPA: CAP domain-containing protein [Acidimicrobiia bacterium]|nr:CAP domain-containing protein [Acidimicrobiia bacterium]
MAGNLELNNYARWWAKYMAEHNSFAHSDIGTLLDPWTIVGENIGAGGNVAGIFGALVNSPLHYNNMVEARFTAVGVGVFIDASGKLWTAHVFAG